MAGRRPKPTAVKEFEGNLGKRELSNNEPKPELGIIDPPQFIKNNAFANEYWNKVSTELDRIGVLSKIDCGALYACCMMYARWMQLENDIQEEGLLVEVKTVNKSGEIIKIENKANPKIVEVRHTLQQYRVFCNEFGLTPASRSKISVAGGDNEDDGILD